MENINGELEIVLVTGKRVHVPVRKYDTIMYVKNQIYKSENIPIQNQRLIANATILQDDWTIGEMELFKNSHIETVHLVLKLSGVSDINKEIQPYVQGDNGQKMAYASTPQQQQKKKKRKAKYNQEGRKRGSYAKRACSHCKQAHAACDSGRPCKRCIMLGKEDTCRDVERKSRRKDNIDYSKEFPDLTSFVDRVAALPDIDEATRHRHNHQIWEQQEQESAMLRSQQQQQPIFLSSPPPPPQQQQYQQPYAQQQQYQPPPPQQHYQQPPSATHHQSTKNAHDQYDETTYIVLGVIGILIGLTGIHRFYIGDAGIGAVQLFMSFVVYALLGWMLGYLTFFLPIIATIWAIVDVINASSTIKNKNR
mmetsp:Transcript_4573/g.6737  ORF Transcript_4573/g.6737 Transcript_4573/m.6737 type:complete len:365 (+) Transcript_4573:38-1132(+)